MRTISQTLLSIFLIIAATSVMSGQTRSPSLFAATAVAAALAEGGVAPDITSTHMNLEAARLIVAHRIDPRLLRENADIFSRNFEYHFESLAQAVQIGVIVLQYPTLAIAKQMVAVSAQRNGFFRNSIILVRFSSVQLNSLLVIVYSENSGDKRVVEAIRDLPTKFAQASSVKTILWSETGASVRN